MKKIWTMVAVLVLAGSVAANAAWETRALEYVSIANATVVIVARNAQSELEYYVYTGTGANDATTVNRVYATALTGIASGQQVMFGVTGEPATRVYNFDAIRVTNTPNP